MIGSLVCKKYFSAPKNIANVATRFVVTPNLVVRVDWKGNSVVFGILLLCLWWWLTDNVSFNKGEVTIKYLNFSSNAVSSARGKDIENAS